MTNDARDNLLERRRAAVDSAHRSGRARRSKLPAVFVALALLGCAGPPAEPTSVEELTAEERMEWWREARFGMFIHWGLYSVLGGEWEGFDYGKEMENASAEWVMLQAAIPKQEYAKLATRFNPVEFDADRWAGIAKQAGMKYLVITSKHHDGFSLFDSQQTDYDIIDASPVSNHSTAMSP